MAKFSRLNKLSLVSCAIALHIIPTISVAQERQTPKLVLQITVDALRGDLPWRYYDRLGEGGFRYLMDQGTVYRDAYHGHANTIVEIVRKLLVLEKTTLIGVM